VLFNDENIWNLEGSGNTGVE